jgi:LacI family transcriptional regulator, galactose operon repressor
MPPSEPTNDNNRPTLGDVASRAGVSRSTASNIMTGFRSDRYSMETQQRVREAAAALNYRPNAAARALVRRSTGVLAMLAWTDVRDIVVGRYAAGVQATAAERGFDVIFADVGHQAGMEAAHARLLAQKAVDGLIIARVGFPSRLQKVEWPRPEPMVLLGPPIAGFDGPRVYVDNWSAGVQAAEHLLDLGHERVAAIRSSRGTPGQEARYQGFHQTWLARGCPWNDEWVVRVQYPDLEAAALELLGRIGGSRPSFSAVYVVNDEVAAVTIHALRRAGFEVPRDVSVISCLDMPLARYLSPPLTTVRYPLEDVGAAAATMLCDMIAGKAPEPRERVFPVELVVRESTAPVSASA